MSSTMRALDMKGYWLAARRHLGAEMAAPFGGRTLLALERQSTLDLPLGAPWRLDRLLRRRRPPAARLEGSHSARMALSSTIRAPAIAMHPWR